jgi:hypothetical protein
MNQKANGGNGGKRGKLPFSPDRKKVLTAGEMTVRNASRFYRFPRPTSPAISPAVFVRVAR